jgi:recombinational DNA repair protein (RecF pathway)
VSALTRCSSCGRAVDAVEVWFHPGTGDATCNDCHEAVRSRHARLTALRGEFR